MEGELAQPGPIDPSVLHLQSMHRSQRIWEGAPVEPLRVYHTELTWRRYVPDSFYHYRLLKLLQKAGFYGFFCTGYRQLDRHLITALVERWRQETHTFHFPVGECTVTLQDVEVLLGLPVDGDAVTDGYIERNGAAWQDLCSELMGFRPSLDAIKGKKILLSAITTHICSRAQHNVSLDPDALLEQDARCIIMLMLGTLLADKSCNKVSLMYLPLIRNLEAAGRLSWGGAVLAHLYSQLCISCKLATGGITGPLMLLQYWAWERLDQIRPELPRLRYDNPQDPLGLPLGPRARHWSDHELQQTDTPGHSVKIYRDLFDQMLPIQFTWEPYKDVLVELPAYCKAGVAVWRVRVPLINFQSVEWHLPDRVIRQFGMRQFVPDDCNTEDLLHSESTQGGRTRDWRRKRETYIRLWDNRRRRDCNTQPTTEELGYDDHYMLWYRRITRMFIGSVVVPPNLRGFQPVAAIRESMARGLVRVSELSQHGLHHVESASETLGQVYREASQLLVGVGESHRVPHDLPTSTPFVPPRLRRVGRGRCHRPNPVSYDDDQGHARYAHSHLPAPRLVTRGGHPIRRP